MAAGAGEGTHRRARGTLEAGETTVTLDASVALFACLTLVTTGALGSLEEWRRQDVRRKVREHWVGCCPHLDRVLRT